MCLVPTLPILRKGRSRPDHLAGPRRLPTNKKNRAEVGDRISPWAASSEANRTIKKAMAELGYRDGPKIPPYAFRRGDTHEIKDVGSVLSLIIQSGTWAQAGYRAYLDLQADYAIYIARFALDALGSDSEGPDDTKPKNERKLSKRMKSIPVAFVDEGGNNE